MRKMLTEEQRLARVREQRRLANARYRKRVLSNQATASEWLEKIQESLARMPEADAAKIRASAGYMSIVHQAKTGERKVPKVSNRTKKGRPRKEEK